ncbi:MAG: NFYB/HAP3 family transcription factor subunit [Candidatus Aenigmatarchaeota archaeon]
MKKIFSDNYFKRVAKELKIERISKEAVETIREILQEEVSEILRVSNEIAKHSKRNTIFKDDIKIAIKKLNF